MAYTMTWDKTGERIFEAGVSRGVLYLLGDEGYGSGIAWNGLTSVSESPEGAEPNDLWADNIKYAVLRSAETLNGTIEAYMCPEEFMACDGSYAAVAGVYVGQQPRKAFGLCYRTEIGSDTKPGIDAGYKLHVIYNATASPSEKTHETINDSPDAMQLSWEFTTTPVVVKGYEKQFKPVSSITIDSTKVDPSVLETLEDTLYGGALPSPAALLELLGVTADSSSTEPSNP